MKEFSVTRLIDLRILNLFKAVCLFYYIWMRKILNSKISLKTCKHQ